MRSTFSTGVGTVPPACPSLLGPCAYWYDGKALPFAVLSEFIEFENTS